MWNIEETDDCGVHWRRAELTKCYLHRHAAVLEAALIIEDEWHPPVRALRELIYALERESIVYYWENGIRVVQGAYPGRSTSSWPI
jgi:hypothetical protein